MLRIVILLTLLTLMTGCATLPNGPSVRVFPAAGKPYDLFLNEDAYCRQSAERQLGLTPQEAADRSTVAGTAIGAAVGTGLGAAIGAASGNAGAGAVIGGISGGFLGAASGSDIGRMEGRNAQYRYDTIYLQCMYAHGNHPYSPAPRYYQRQRVRQPPARPFNDSVPPDYLPLYPPPGTPPPPAAR
jgi:hypothetical protein